MSLFLVYFEFGKPVAAEPFPVTFSHRPIAMTFRGYHGRTREAMVLTHGGSSEHFVAFEQGYKQEGRLLRTSLFEFVQQRLEAGAQPHLVFHWFGGKVETISIDIDHVVRVPTSKLEDKFRAIEALPIVDSSDVMAVTRDDQGDEEQPHPASNVLVDISTENAAIEPDPMNWKGNIDVLVGETLIRVGSSHGSVFVLRGLVALGGMIARLRGSARIVAHTFVKDTSPLRFVRQTTGGTLAVTAVYRDVETAPAPVTALDEACRDAVLQFFRGLGTEQRLALRSEEATRLLGAVAAVWPELKQAT